MEKEEVLKQCTVEGQTVKLPSIQLDRKLYQDVAKSLNLIGGKWKSGKVQGFVFDQDPTELLESICGGEKRNLKKEFQFFATPDHIADRLVELAELSEWIYEHNILEPSAGQGSIINAIKRKGNYNVSWFELMPVNQIFLNKIDKFKLLGNDFLTECITQFDRIIANPPFSKNQDITHIKKMYECLSDEGILVSIASTHWQNSNNKKETEFREWLDKVGAEIIELDAGEFKESGTMVKSVILKIKK